MIGLLFSYIANIPWSRLAGSPYGTWLRPDHSKRLVIYCNGSEMIAGGFFRGRTPSGTPIYRVGFAWQKKVTPDWFEKRESWLPSAWKKEHVSFFAGSVPFNIECNPVPLPETAQAEIEYSPEHPVAQEITRWATINRLNLHYSSIGALELVLQWFHSREEWEGDEEVRFFIGYDGQKWFLAGASVAGLCAFTWLEQAQESIEMMARGTNILGAKSLGEIALFAPGREDEILPAVQSLRDTRFPDTKIDAKPFGDVPIPFAKNMQADLLATRFLQGLLPGGKITHA